MKSEWVREKSRVRWTLWEAPNCGKLEGWLSVGSQLHRTTCLHPPPEWAGLRLPPPILLAPVIFLHQHLPTFLAAATEEKLVPGEWKVQDVRSALRLWVMLEGGRERKGEILLLPDWEVGTKRWGASSSSGPTGWYHHESSIRRFKSSPAATDTHLSGVLVGRQGGSAAQAGFTALSTPSRDRLLARWSISSWTQQIRPPAGQHG